MTRMMLAGFASVVVTVASSGVSAAVLYVDKNATGTPIDGTTWDRAYRSLTAATTEYENNTSFTEIWVADGTYKLSTSGNKSASMEFLRNVKLFGGFKGAQSGGYETLASQANPEANPTVIDGDLSGNDGSGIYTDNTYHLIQGYSVSNATQIDGLTFRNGNSADSVGRGGAIRWGGGGDAPSILISRCKFEKNRAKGDGSGAPEGGAIALASCSSKVRGCKFVGNEAASGSLSYLGHGGAIWTDSAIDIANSLFDANSATGLRGAGGAVFVDGALARIGNCSFVGNGATILSGSTHTGYGGAVTLQSANVNSLIVNCLFSGNVASTYGGGLFASNGANVRQCTFTANEADAGGGLYFDASSVSQLRNCVLWGNLASGTNVLAKQYAIGSGATITVTYSCVAGISSGTGNISSNPYFVDADGADNDAGTTDDDCRLLCASPAIDVGDQSLRPDDVNDVDNDLNFSEAHPLDLDASARIVGSQMDMGAYETVVSTCRSDLNHDGNVAAADYSILLGQWGTLGTADLDCDGNVGAADLAILLGDWGSCGSFMMAMASASESDDASPLTPAELAVVLGFGSFSDFLAWLETLDFNETQEVLAPLTGT